MPFGIHYSRIESLETSPGFPDVHYTLKGRSGTLELKCQPKPSGPHPFSGERGLRKTQKLWIRDELAAGGRVLLVLQAFQRIYFVPGSFWHALDTAPLAYIELNSLLIWDRDQGKGTPFSLSEILMN